MNVALTENRAVVILASHFNCWQNLCFPNVYLCGGEMDLAIVTRAGYLWECEIKLTRANWLADARKKKWLEPARRFVSRFFYAVPESLVTNVPEFVPETAGLLVFCGAGVREVRTAKRKTAPKLPDPLRQQLYSSTYYRFWQQRFHRLRLRPSELIEAEAA